jgi:hypothetical protein
MLDLNNLEEWEKIDSPFQNSEDIPLLVKKLKQTLNKEILIKLTTEYMYHQGSLYESTFATFPHLIEICESNNDLNYRLETLLNLTIDLAEFNGETELKSTFENSKCNLEIVNDIICSFNNSFKNLNPIAESLMNLIVEKEEYEKRYFLLALAVANEIFQVSTILWIYGDNEEYICCCPNCNKKMFLWNEDGKLVLYVADPVFNKKQNKYLVQPSSLNKSDFSSKISSDKNYEWLSYYIEKLNIESLKTIINYLFGNTTCPHCKTKFEIYENISL